MELTATTFIRYIREEKKLEGWVVLIIDSGGGQHGLHLTMEFTLLMYRNQVEVVALAEYFTKAMMPLDRDPHREMELAWSTLRTDFAAKTGQVVSTQFQASVIITTTTDITVISATSNIAANSRPWHCCERLG